MKAGYLQNSPVFGEKDKNLEAADQMLNGVEAALIVLPELFATGYSFTSAEELGGLSETVGGLTTRFLCRKSLETGAVIVAGFAERDGDCFYNSAMMVAGGDVIGIYRKLHLFNKEKLFFTPGNTPLRVFTVNGCRVGMMICFDWIFPEVSRALALAGAQIIAHPSNLVLPWCQQAMVTRCIENRVFAVTANRVGLEKRGEYDFRFTGGSQVTSCSGEILSSGSSDAPCLGFVEIDPHRADNKMINPYNDVLADRRPEFY